MLTNHVRAATLLLRTPLRPSEDLLSPIAALASRLRRPLISLSVWGRLQGLAEHLVLLARPALHIQHALGAAIAPRCPIWPAGDVDVV